MGRFHTVDADSVRANQDKYSKAFDALMDQYNDKLAEPYDTPEPAAPSASLVVPPKTAPSVQPADTPAAPRAMNSRVAEQFVQPDTAMHDPLLGGGVTAAALKSDSTYKDMSYQSRRQLADKALEQARAALLKSDTSADSVSTTLSNMRREYSAALGPEPESNLISDTGFRLTGGLLGGVASVATGVAGVDNPVSRYLNAGVARSKTLLSPAAQDHMKLEAEQKTALGKDPSELAQAKLAALQYGGDITGKVAETVGGMAPLIAGAPLGSAGVMLLSGIMGAGTVRQAIYDKLKNMDESALMADPAYAAMRATMPEADAKEKYALKQQEFLQNTGAILGAGAVGGAAAALGPAQKLVSGMGKAYAEKAARDLASRSVAGAVARDAAIQTGIGASQNAANTVATNYAARSGGVDVPLTQGLGANMTEGALAGPVLGGPAGYHGRSKAIAQVRKLDTIAAVKAAAKAEVAKKAADATVPPVDPAAPPVDPAAPPVDPAAPPGTPPVANPKVRPENAGPFAEQYAAMGVPAEEMQSKFGVRNTDGTFTDVRLTDIDPAKFEDLTGTPLSHTIEGVTDEVPAAVANANQIDTTAPYADVPGAVRPTAEAAALKPEVIGFTTSKGSSYAVDGNSTTRNKAVRNDPGHEGDFGPKPASEATYYLTSADAQSLGEVQADGVGRQIAVLPDGRIGVQYTEGPQAGKFEGRTVITPSTEPAIGLTPLELWGQGRTSHFGNPIVSVKTKAVADPAANVKSPSGVGPLNQALDTVVNGPASEALAAAFKTNKFVDISSTPGVTPEQIQMLSQAGYVQYGHMTQDAFYRARQENPATRTPGVDIAYEPTTTPRALVRPEPPMTQVETRLPPDPSEVFTTSTDGRPRTVKDQATAAERRREQTGQLSVRGDSYVDGEGRPVTAEEHTAITQAIASVAALDTQLKAAVAPVTKAAKLKPAGKKKVSDTGEVNDNARASVEPQGREGQVAPVESAGNTEAVAGQEAGAATGVGVDLQKPAGAGREAEASGGRSGAGTAGAEPSAVAGGKQPKSRLAKPDKVDGRRRPAGEIDLEKTATKEQATEHWDDMVDPKLGVSYGQLGPRAQERWADLTARFLAGESPKKNPDFSTPEANRLAQEHRSTAQSEKMSAQRDLEDARNKQDFGRALTPQGEVDHPTVWAAAKTGSAEAVLEAVAKTNLTPEQRQIVDKLRGKLGGVVVVPSEGSKSPSYNHQHKTVTLNNGSAESALHELGHAGTLEALAEVQQGRGTPEQVSAVHELAKLQQVIEAEGKLSDVSAFKPSSYEGVDPSQQNMVRAAEIVAEVNASSRAQRALARISGDGKAFNGVQRFVAAVRDLLGLKPSADSALAKVLRLTDPLIAKTEPGANALENSGFALGDLQRNIINKKPDESWADYARKKGLAFSESDWVASNLSKRPTETWPGYIARKFAEYKAPVAKAEQGFTVISNDGKHLQGFDNRAAAEAYQAQHVGSRIDTKVSMFTGDRSIDSFMERERNMVSARLLADGEGYVNPLKQKLQDYYESRSNMNPTEAHAELNNVAHALISVDANEVGRRLHTPLNELAEAKRRSIRHDVVMEKISASTAWRMQKVLTDNLANRALDEKGKPLPIREDFSGMSTAEAKEVIAKSKEATEFLTKTALTELNAIRERLKQLSVESEQFDKRGAKLIDMYDQKHYFPLYGDEGGPLIDVGKGFGSTESGTLHQREGRNRKAHLPFDALVDDLDIANQRIVERDKNHLLLRMFYAANNKNSEVHELAKTWFKQAGIRYEKSDVLDATDQSKNANQATQGSSKTIIARNVIANGKGKIQQTHFTVDDSTSNGQQGASFISAWSGSNVAQPGSFIRMLTAATRLRTSVMTRLMPTFAPADWYRTQKMVGSMLTGDFGLDVGVKFMSHMAETNPLAMGKVISGSSEANPKLAQAVREMMDMGALTTNAGKYGLRSTTLELQGARRFGQLREKLAHTVDTYNEAFEWSPRVAAYITLREHGLSASDAGLWSLKVANFSMQGEWTPIIRAFVPFYNPGMQGIRRQADVVHQVAAGNHRMTGVLVTRALTAAVMYGLMNSFAGKDENGVDKFAKMNDSKHYRNDYIPNPLGDGFIALPRPIDMGPVDGFGIAIARVMLGHSMPSQALGEYAQEGLQRVSPVEAKNYSSIQRNMIAAFSSGFGPFYEVDINETGLGVPISNDHKQNKKDAAFDGRETTPQIYKDVTAGMARMGVNNVSPEDVRHLFKSYGMWFAAGADALATAADKTQAPASNTAKLTPLVGRFMEPVPTSDARFYDLAKNAEGDFKKVNNNPDEASKTAYRAANPKAAASADLWKKLDAAEKALGKEGKALNQPPVEKKAYMLEKRNRIHDDFIRQYREIYK